MSAEQSNGKQATILLYSDDRNVREQVRLALGSRVASDLPVQVVECATPKAVMTTMANGGVDLCVLDGEAVPAGGMGVCRQLKDEIPNCPPVMLLVARRDDAWLATWSRADGVAPYPVNPMTLPGEVADLLRARLDKAPVRA